MLAPWLLAAKLSSLNRDGCRITPAPAQRQRTRPTTILGALATQQAGWHVALSVVNGLQTLNHFVVIGYTPTRPRTLARDGRGRAGYLLALMQCERIKKLFTLSFRILNTISGYELQYIRLFIY